MICRDRLLTALRRGKPDRVPYMLAFNREALRLAQEKTGMENPCESFSIPMDFEHVGFRESVSDFNHFSRFFKNLKPGTYFNQWGTAFEPGSNPAFDHLVAPLEGERSIKEIENYPLPDYTIPFCHEHLESDVASIQSKGLAAIAAMEMTIFEVAWQVRGYEDLITGFLTDDEGVTLLLDRLTQMRFFMASRFAQAGVDILRLGDDVGMQHQMMLSPSLWRKWLKPRLAGVIQSAKSVKPDIIISYHSDGYIEPVIEDLIEIGVDVLNPVQPECMNPAALKDKYGDRLAFSGTIGTQTTMPFGTPDEVRLVVKERIETVGRDDGLFIGPTHVLEPEVPWGNIVAFVEAVEEYGNYETYSINA